MRVMEVTRDGGPEVLQERSHPDPAPAAGEVRIRVRYAEVLFIDTQLRAGWGQEYFAVRPPWVPGTGVAGTVDAVGDGVPAARVGARVIARTSGEGGYAEFATVPDAEAFDVPDGLDLATATAALHDAVLALDRLERADLNEHSRVLVTAAAGALGQWFVPLAKAAGALVVGAAGGPAKAAAVARLGADHAVDYRREDWAAEAGTGFTVVFDGVGGEIGRTALSLTADGGRFFAYGASSGEFGADRDDGGERGITVIPVQIELTDAEWRRHTRRGLELLAQGLVQPTVGQEVPLGQAARAHRMIGERRVIGKSLLVA